MTDRSAAIANALLELNRYARLVQITEGANAYAFSARNIILNRDAFLKVYDYCTLPGVEILREPQCLVSVMEQEPRCPNVIELFHAEVLEIHNAKYVLCEMAYVHGESLLELLNRENIGQQKAVRILLDILHGVSHLHANNILHRDLKPANIMYDGTIPKIADFGSAALLPSGCTSIAASQHSALYVPPESWPPMSQYSIQSDIYQCGVLLYELINGSLESKEEHYLTKQTQKELRNSGRTFDSLDPCEKCIIVNFGIKELARKQLLLEHGRPIRAYCSRRILQIIRKANSPDLGRRYRLISNFSADLSRLNLPNWRISPDGLYTAEAWKGADWKAEITQFKGIQNVSVFKTRHGSGNFRRSYDMSGNDPSSVFRAIENL